MNNQLYTDFYNTYYKTIQMWVAKAGIPYQEVPDVSSEIILKIIEKDGMGNYDPTRGAKVNTYLNRYVFLTARSYREKLLNPKIQVRNLDDVFWRHIALPKQVDRSQFNLFDHLYKILEGDALEFLKHASESGDYTQARKCLSDKGWDKKRITSAVIQVRKATKKCMSEASA